MCGCTSATKNIRPMLRTKADSHRGHREHRERKLGQHLCVLRDLGGHFRICVGRRSIASAARERRAREKRFGRRGSPLGAEADLDCGKKGFLASARGTRSHDAAGQHRHLTNQARFVRSTLPPSPGPPVEAALPIRHTAMRIYRPAHATAVARDQRRAKAGTQELMPLARRGPRKNHDEP